MFAALLTTLLFSISAICGHRTSTRLGGVEANFWRICGAMFFLTLWANTLGTGTSGAAFPFLFSADWPASAWATPPIFRRCRGSAAAGPFCSPNASPRCSPR